MLELPYAPRLYRDTPARATGNDAFTRSPSIQDWYETVKINYGMEPRTGKKAITPQPRTWGIYAIGA